MRRIILTTEGWNILDLKLGCFGRHGFCDSGVRQLQSRWGSCEELPSGSAFTCGGREVRQRCPCQSFLWTSRAEGEYPRALHPNWWGGNHARDDSKLCLERFFATGSPVPPQG